MATRNSGTEMRLRVPKVTVRSSRDPGYIAARSPRAIEMGIAMTATTLARRRVFQEARNEHLRDRGADRPEAGARLGDAEVSRSRDPPATGSSARTAARRDRAWRAGRRGIPGVAIWPRMMLATSPGSTLVPMKMRTETTSRGHRPRSPVRRRTAVSSTESSRNRECGQGSRAGAANRGRARLPARTGTAAPESERPARRTPRGAGVPMLRASIQANSTHS